MPQKRKSIGLLTAFTPEILRSQYFTRIISGVIDGLRSTEYDLRLIMVKDEEYADPTYKILQSHDIEGLLFLTWRIHPRYIEEATQESKLPVVLINDFTPEVKTNIVYCNNRAGIELAFRHLLRFGFKKIGMIQGPDEFSLDARERFEAFGELLKQHELSMDPAHYRKCEYFFEEDGYLKMMDMIQTSSSLPRAVMCFNDDIAIGAMRALKESWIKCPEQVAIIGYDGLERGKYVVPSLTTISQPLGQMGREMVSILVDVLKGRSTGVIQREFFPELIIRQSA